MIRNLLSLILIIVAVTITVTLTKPRLDSIQILKLQENDIQAALENSRRLNDKWNEIVGKYNKFTASDIDKLDKVLPDNVDNVKLIIELSELAKNMGLELSGVNVAEKGDSKTAGLVPYGTLSLDIALRGSYDNFVAYAEQVESSLRLLDIRAVSFKPNLPVVDPVTGDTSASDVYDYNLAIDTYWLR